MNFTVCELHHNFKKCLMGKNMFETFVGENRKKKAGQTLGGNLTYVEQRGKRGQRSNQSKHIVCYIKYLIRHHGQRCQILLGTDSE